MKFFKNPQIILPFLSVFVLFACSKSASYFGGDVKTTSVSPDEKGSLKKLMPALNDKTSYWGLSTTAPLQGYKRFQIISTSQGSGTPISLSGMDNENIFDLAYLEASSGDISHNIQMACFLKNRKNPTNLWGNQAPPDQGISKNRGDYIAQTDLGGDLFCTDGNNVIAAPKNTNGYIALVTGFGTVCALNQNKNNDGSGSLDCFNITSDKKIVGPLQWTDSSTNQKGSIFVKYDDYVVTTDKNQPVVGASATVAGSQPNLPLQFALNQKNTNKSMNDDMDCFYGETGGGSTSGSGKYYCMYSHFPEVQPYVAIGNSHACFVSPSQTPNADQIKCASSQDKKISNFGQLGLGYNLVGAFKANTLYKTYDGQTQILSIGAGGQHTCFVETANLAVPHALGSDQIKCFGYNFVPFAPQNTSYPQTQTLVGSLFATSALGLGQSIGSGFQQFLNATPSSIASLQTYRGTAASDHLKIFTSTGAQQSDITSSDKTWSAFNHVFAGPTQVPVPSTSNITFQGATANTGIPDQYRVYGGQGFTCVHHMMNPWFSYNSAQGQNCSSGDNSCTAFDSYMGEINNQLFKGMKQSLNNQSGLFCFGDLSDFYGQTGPLPAINSFFTSNNFYSMEARFSQPYAVFAAPSVSDLSGITFDSCKTKDTNEEYCAALFKTGITTTGMRAKAISQIPVDTSGQKYNYFLSTNGAGDKNINVTNFATKYQAYNSSVNNLWIPNIDVAAGDAHACSLRADGKMICWGDNRFCQMKGTSGINSYTPTCSPPTTSLMPTIMNTDNTSYVKGITVGRDAACAITTKAGKNAIQCAGELYDRKSLLSPTSSDNGIFNTAFQNPLDGTVTPQQSLYVADFLLGYAKGNQSSSTYGTYSYSNLSTKINGTPSPSTAPPSYFIVYRNSPLTYQPIISYGGNDGFARNTAYCLIPSSGTPNCDGTIGSNTSPTTGLSGVNAIAFSHATFAGIDNKTFTLKLTDLTGKPVTSPSLSGSFFTVTAGVRHICAIDFNGVVQCFGDGYTSPSSNYLNYGQLGYTGQDQKTLSNVKLPTGTNTVNTMIGADSSGK